MGSRFLFAILISTSVLSAKDRAITASWGELGSLIAEERVAIVLPSTARIEGRVLAVEADALRIRVAKTSDPRAHPKGEAHVPRSSVNVLELIETRGVLRKLFAGLGAFGGYTLGFGITRWARGDEGSVRGSDVAGWAALAVGAGIGGYYAGRRFDREVRVIRVRPSP